MKIAIFASGSGSNAENIINYFSENKYIECVIVVSDKAGAYVHERAARLGVPSVTFNKNEFGQPDALVRLLAETGIDFIVLAGFLLKISKKIIDLFPNRIVNIHPALLPKYGGRGMYGKYVHEAVVAAGEKESGITIHYINECYDEGAIIFQASCPVVSSDTPDDVAARVHALEYRYYPEIIEKVIGALPATISLGRAGQTSDI